MEDKFTWVPFFEELLDKICKEYNKEKLYSVWHEFFPDQYTTVDNDTEVTMTKIDPLSFVGKIISLGDTELGNKCERLKLIFDLNNIVPTDFTGIPRLNRTNCLFWNEYWKNRTNKNDLKYLDYVLDILWDFAKDLNTRNENNADYNLKNFETILNFDRIGLSKLSQIIFLFKPNIFFACDDKMVSFLHSEIKDHKSINDFIKIQELAKSHNKKPYELSYDAYLYCERRQKFFNYINKIKESMPSYASFLNNQLFKEQFEHKIFELTQKKLFEIKTNDVLDNLLKELKNISDWNTYNSGFGNGIPYAILNKHYRNFINGNDTISLKKDFVNDGEKTMQNIEIPKNQILYGPPGTGKTYNTVIEAIKILNESLFDDYKANIKSYEDLKNEFNRLKQLGQIEFVTFHQSYSYEEFVEGIKPNLESDSLGYKLSDGTFKKIANNALFASLNILEEDSNTSFEFNKILDVFKEQYPVETVLETEKSSFKIIDYIETSIRVSPVDSNHIYSVSYQPLEEMFKIHIENPYSMPKDLADKFGSFKGLSTYYFNILEKLKNIHSNQFTKNINVTNEYTSEQKNLFIKKFYKKEISTKDNNKLYVLIIDEINRGNISKIFGELITLLEEDKRENLTVKLPYSQEEFTVPKNLYILGTMNTSDRSIASVDIALRRRFVFKEMMPDSKLVSDFGCNFKKCFEVLNERISILLDRDHQIGHSYFIDEKYINSDINTLKKIWFDSIIPLLNEYFYGDWEKLQAILGEAKDDNTSFIKVKKVDKDSFAAKVDFCDDKSFDFNYNCNFASAMEKAFGDNFNGVTND